MPKNTKSSSKWKSLHSFLNSSVCKNEIMNSLDINIIKNINIIIGLRVNYNIICFKIPICLAITIINTKAAKFSLHINSENMDIDEHKKNTNIGCTSYIQSQKSLINYHKINVKSSMIMIFEEEGGILLIEN